MNISIKLLIALINIVDYCYSYNFPIFNTNNKGSNVGLLNYNGFGSFSDFSLDWITAEI
jgi:hypothetical protein